MRYARSKYGAVRSEYRGRTYDSALERNTAIFLDSFVRSGRISSVTPQHLIRISVGGKKVCDHVVDFLVTFPDGRRRFVEAKGVPTDAWKLKRKLVEALYSDTPYLVNPTEEQLFS